jgi:hypothetical protein
MAWFERVLREQAAAFAKAAVRRANDPLPDEEPGASERLRLVALSAAVRHLLRHAAVNFSRQAFREMAARARKDSRRYPEFARCSWSKALGVDMAEIRLPENMRQLEERFWRSVDAAIDEALRSGEPEPAKKRKRSR